MLDFNKYNDVVQVKDYDGFIDRDGNYYKVVLRREKSYKDSHNIWAEKFLKEKIDIKNLKLNLNYSTIFKLIELKGPAEILINCLGFVYYSHDSIYYKPIVKIPNPKIFGKTVTDEQLDMLCNIMLCNKENIDIPILYGDTNEYEYCGLEDNQFDKKKKI